MITTWVMSVRFTTYLGEISHLQLGGPLTCHRNFQWIIHMSKVRRRTKNIVILDKLSCPWNSNFDFSVVLDVGSWIWPSFNAFFFWGGGLVRGTLSEFWCRPWWKISCTKWVYHSTRFTERFHTCQVWFYAFSSPSKIILGKFSYD